MKWFIPESWEPCAHATPANTTIFYTNSGTKCDFTTLLSYSFYSPTNNSHNRTVRAPQRPHHLTQVGVMAMAMTTVVMGLSDPHPLTKKVNAQQRKYKPHTHTDKYTGWELQGQDKGVSRSKYRGICTGPVL